LLNSNISPTCPHNMAKFCLLAAVICLPVWGTPANFNGFRVLPSLYYSDVAHRRPTKLCTKFDCLLRWHIMHYVYIFDGCCPLTEFCQVQNSLYVQGLRSPILAALLHVTPSAGVRQTLLCAELSQRAPRIFGWAAITLGIGPHFSFCLVPYGRLS